MGGMSEKEWLLLLGNNIRNYRLSLGLEQYKIAEICNFKATKMSGIELGKTEITMLALFKISKALNVPLDEILKKILPSMNVIKVNNGIVEVRSASGLMVREIGNGDAAFVDFNTTQTQILITTKNGLVELRNGKGDLVRNIGNGNAITARWNDGNVAITTQSGKTEIRKKNGTLIACN